jgi:hypothetical protein
MTSIIIDSHFIIDSNKVPEKKQLLQLDGAFPTPSAKNKENRPASQNPNRNRKTIKAS